MLLEDYRNERLKKFSKDNNIIYSALDDGTIFCHTNRKLYRNYEHFTENMFLDKTKDELIDEILKNKDELDKYKNIVDELEKWLQANDEHYAEALPFKETLKKLKELKGE